MDFPDDVTIGDKYMPAMVITDQAAADEYFEALVAHTMRVAYSTREEAEAIERDNLGYFAGYYDSATRERVERLFRCAHPVFGSIATNGPPSPKAALASGEAMAKKLDRGHSR